MIDIYPFSEEQYGSLCSCNCSMPVLLEKADLKIPFVYSRQYGVFYTPSGFHNLTMATLLAFSHGLTKPLTVCEPLGLKMGISVASDYWLEHAPGAAFKSSVSDYIQAGKPKNLNEKEKDYFGKIKYIFNE